MTQNCQWLSYSKLLETCILFDMCPEIVNSADFVTSEVDCNYQENSGKILNCVNVSH